MQQTSLSLSRGEVCRLCDGCDTAIIAFHLHVSRCMIFGAHLKENKDDRKQGWTTAAGKIERRIMEDQEENQLQNMVMMVIWV